MNALFAGVRRIAVPFLRSSPGISLLWIGALKFVEPTADQEISPL